MTIDTTGVVLQQLYGDCINSRIYETFRIILSWLGISKSILMSEGVVHFMIQHQTLAIYFKLDDVDRAVQFY